MNFFLLINVRMPTVVDFLTFMSRTNSILGELEPERSSISFYTYEHFEFDAELSMKKVLYSRGQV